jgi:predicted NodU family carbamoyl transferase
MINGYYLSTYLHIHPLAFLYNISIRHDQTVALWKVQDTEVNLIRYWELERKTGIKKHALSFFSIAQCHKILNMLLSEVSLTLNGIQEIWGTPGLEIKGSMISSYKNNNPCPYHSICHLFSGIAINTDALRNTPTIAFALDGGPDNVVDKDARNKLFYWGLYINHNQLTYFPVPSPGAFWSFLRLKTGLEEGTLMALGSASTSFHPRMEEMASDAPLIYKGEDFNNANLWVDSIIHETQAINIEDIKNYDERFDECENRISMAVKVIQNASINIMHKTMERTVQTYNILPSKTRLVMTGGFALNCPTNTYLMNRFGFFSFDTCPCVSDSGIALGIGLYEFFNRLPNFTFKLENAFHGSIENRNSMFFCGTNWEPFIETVMPFDTEVFAKDVLTDIVIWFDGQAEIGPRALGARSILGNPSSINIKNRLNQIKKRQWWRPVAPIILEETLNNWFINCFISPYMLCTCYAHVEKESSIKAVLHLDNSARIQTITHKNCFLLVQGIQKYYQDYGIPIICNTSLNDKGEPIVDSFDQCLNFALRKGILIVYLNGYRYHLKNHQEYSNSNPLPRHSDWFFMDEKKKDYYKRIYNPGNLSIAELDIYLNFPELSSFCLQDEKQIKRLKRILKQWKRLSQTVWAAMLL